MGEWCAGEGVLSVNAGCTAAVVGGFAAACNLGMVGETVGAGSQSSPCVTNRGEHKRASGYGLVCRLRADELKINRSSCHGAHAALAVVCRRVRSLKPHLAHACMAPIMKQTL